MNLRGRIGIMQGRLVPSVTGEMQCSPGERWPDEFQFARDIGLGHIELMAEASYEPTNPLWTAEGRGALAGVAAATGVRTRSLCLNEPIATALTGTGVADELAARLERPCAELGVEVLVVPLLDASAAEAGEFKQTAAALRVLNEAVAPKGTRLALEVGLTADEAARLLAEVGDPGVGICYDLGNATAQGYDVAAELKSLGSLVVHVHAKDTDDSGRNVGFGSGRVAFGAALGALDAIAYRGLVTIEATRGDDPVTTASRHLAFLGSIADGGEFA